MANVYEASAVEDECSVTGAAKAFKGGWAQTVAGDLIDATVTNSRRLKLCARASLINLVRCLEIAQGLVFLRYFDGWAIKIAGETTTPTLQFFAGEQYTAFTRREPVGVVAGIVLWSFSVMTGIRKIASALATGCTVVIEIQRFHALTLLRIAELAIKGGIHAGVFNVLNGHGSIGQQLIDHSLV